MFQLCKDLFPRRTKMRTSQVTPTDLMKLTFMIYETRNSYQVEIHFAFLWWRICLSFSYKHTSIVWTEYFVKFLHFIFVTLTTVVADADERFGKAYLRWASPVAISEIKPDLRFKKKVIHRNITRLQLVFIEQLDQRNRQRFLTEVIIIIILMKYGPRMLTSRPWWQQHRQV